MIQTTTCALRLASIRKVFPGPAPVHALRGVSLAVRAGTVCVIEGPSGSGKTTLLAITGGLDRPTGGRVWVHGHELTAIGGRALLEFRRANFGFVFQDFELIDVLSAEENVAIALELAGVRRRDALERARALLAALGLMERRRALPRLLSGGEQQRVAIARALVGEPGIVLADEPTANLDWEHGKDVMGLLTGVARERGTAVVVVSHDPRVAACADQVVRLEDGLVVGGGAAWEVA
jgi:putative ABC transport system ATP-binding protein